MYHEFVTGSLPFTESFQRLAGLGRTPPTDINWACPKGSNLQFANEQLPPSMKFVNLAFSLSVLSSLASGVFSATVLPRVVPPGADTPLFYLVSTSASSGPNLLVRKFFPVIVVDLLV